LNAVLSLLGEKALEEIRNERALTNMLCTVDSMMTGVIKRNGEFLK
jgi:hypothetical protein